MPCALGAGRCAGVDATRTYQRGRKTQRGARGARSSVGAKRHAHLELVESDRVIQLAVIAGLAWRTQTLHGKLGAASALNRRRKPRRRLRERRALHDAALQNLPLAVPW